jgi:hypothetical protein
MRDSSLRAILATRIFTTRQLWSLGLGFGLVVFVLQRLLRYVCARVVEFDCPFYWPISIFDVAKPTLSRCLSAAGALVLFVLAVRYLSKRRYPLGAVIVAGVLLVIASTLIQGWYVGLYTPIAGDARSGTLIPVSTDGQEYYHDALAVHDPVQFLRDYATIQPTLHRHAHTHPPGAVLALYVLAKLLVDPGLIAVFIASVSVSLSCAFLYGMLVDEVAPDTARYVAFLFALLPAIQIYFLASLDALVTALLIGTLFFFTRSNATGAIAGSALMLMLALQLTFVSVCILPVLAGFELLRRRSVARTAAVVAVLLAGHVLVYALSGYDPLRAFLVASAHDNPQGFRGVVEPVNYFFTRLEDVAELLLFFGPFLLVLLTRSLRSARGEESSARDLALLASGTILAMFMTGAFRTGETARPLAFLYACWLLPVGRYIDGLRPGDSERAQLALLVFGQTVFMQLLGNFFW